MATSAPKAASKASSADAAQSADKPKKSRVLMIALALLIILGGGGAAAWYFLGHNAEAARIGKTQDAEANNPPVFLPMDSFTVNLQSENGDQFLQTSFTLQVPNQAQVDLIKLYMPHVRSRLLLLLSGKKASDILTIEGKNKLAQEIMAVLKRPFSPQGPSVNVTSVLFTSFVVQ